MVKLHKGHKQQKGDKSQAGTGGGMKGGTERARKVILYDRTRIQAVEMHVICGWLRGNNYSVIPRLSRNGCKTSDIGRKEKWHL